MGLFDGEKETHPSYGLLQISRISGNPGPLFGSTIECGHTIMLRVHRACVRRDLHRDWYGDEENIVEVEMSANQFAEAITSLNCGFGVPCTIRRLAGRSVERPTHTPVREKFKAEFQEVMAGVVARFDADIAAITDALAKPTLNKADRKAISDALNRLRMELGENVPFTHRQFDEAVDKTVAEAKAEIDAFLTHAVVNAGRLAIAAKMEAEQLTAPVVSVAALEAKP